MPEEPPLVKHFNIPYAKIEGVDPNLLSLNLYAPAGAQDAPVMVYVHGGGWSMGDKSAVGKKAEFFTGAGWILASVNYRLLPSGRHPRNVEDIAAAVAWVHDNIAEHGGDPESIFLMGHSAGCHLVSLVATDGSHLEKAGKSLDVIKGVVALDTQAYDVEKLLDRPLGSATYRSVFGEEQEAVRNAAPIRHVARDKGIPPFLVCYSRGLGRRASPQRAAQARAFAAALREAGVGAEIVDASDRSHGEINQWFGDPEDEKVTGRAKAFLEALRKQRP
ncbi:MAG: alpha/beta hydrolase [Planctomycetota bacterium]